MSSSGKPISAYDPQSVAARAYGELALEVESRQKSQQQQYSIEERVRRLEEVLLNVMYEVPSRNDVARVVVNRDTVLHNVNPTLVPRQQPDHKRERREKSAYPG